MNTYRVFVSYAHEDLALARQVVQVLEKNGMLPLWDENFAFGHGFPEQIKTFIAHAHVFLPIITEAASRRGWVHQEIGYAMALNVPVLPITLGTLPGEMIQQLHAVQLNENLGVLEDQLSMEMFIRLINRHADPTLALHECAELTEDRALMMARYANEVVELGFTGCVRQKGALSSFHIPEQPTTAPVWEQRYGNTKRSPYHCRLQRNERLALDAHARRSGCRIIIDPSILYSKYGFAARRVRLETLVAFLESMPDDKVHVAINARMHQEESLTIVGDWFTAESVSASIGQGYRQTIFTRHAPSIAMRIELFDREMDALLMERDWDPGASRQKAIDALEEIIDGINVR